MQPFDYFTPESIAEATALLSRNNGAARVLAGGTDLLTQMRAGVKPAAHVIDVKRIPELNELSYDDHTGLSIGAAVPCFRIWNDPNVIRLYPGIVDAVSLIGGIQIQSRATLGGNLANASPAADSIPALIAHEALVEIAGPDTVRMVPVADFCTGPGRTVLGAGEFVVRFHLKPPPAGFGAHYLRFIPRNEMDIAVASAGAAVVLEPDGSTIRQACIALGAVAPTPLLATDAGAALAGQPVSDAAIEAAGRLAASITQPINDIRGTIAQRQHLAAVLTRRALRTAIDRARQNLQDTQL